MRHLSLTRRAFAASARSLLVLAPAFFVLAGASQGQGLVQVGFGGEIGSADFSGIEGARSDGSQGEDSKRDQAKAAREGAGHLVEVEVGVMTETGEQRVDLHLHLASRTTGADLAAFVARRLERAGFEVLAPPGKDGTGHLWIEDATFVHVRTGSGMWSEVVACEGAPALLRVRPPEAIPGGGHVKITASTASPHDGKRGSATLDVDLVPDDRAPHTAEKIHAASLEAWVSDRPGNDAWRPVKMQDGHYLTGLSARIDGAGDWRLELALPAETAPGR